MSQAPRDFDHENPTPSTEAAYPEDRRVALHREVHGRRDHRFVAVVAAACTLLGVGVGFGLSQLEMPGCKRAPVVRRAVWAPISVEMPTRAPRITMLGVVTRPGERGRGVDVEAVVPNTPAHRAGLTASDAVVAIDGEHLDCPGELSWEVRRRSPGESVKLDIERGDGVTDTVRVTLGSRPARLHPHRIWR